MGLWLRRTAAAYRAQWHALRRWRPTPIGLAIRVALSVFSAWLSLIITIALAPGIDRDPGTTGLLAVAVIGAADFLLRPLLLAAVLPIGLVGVMVAGLIYRALSFFFILPLVGFELGGLGSAILGAGMYAVVSTILGGLVGMTDEESFGQRVVNQVIKDLERVPPTQVPGVVVIQVDGLAFPILAAQVRVGTLTTLSRWIRSGTHRMIPWTAQLPSQTSTSQAGLLHGNNDGIPAFRWYEKERRRMMVSNRPPDAAEIEARISDGNGLLANGGASIDNMFSGDATFPRLTMSTLRSDRDRAGRDRSIYYFLLNPYSLGRTIVRTAGELIKELYQAWQQHRRGIEPRMHRGLKFAALRSTTNVVLRDLNLALVSEQMLRGTPVIYVDFVDYDDIAHHVGPERMEALHSLSGIDRAIGRLRRLVRDCPRPYRFVIVSDHGQSQGATFRQRYGETIEEWLRTRMHADVTRTATKPTEDAGRLSTVLTEAVAAPGRAGDLSRRALRSRTTDGTVELGALAEEPAEEPTEQLPDLVVCASGNLALVYFGVGEHRLTLEEIEAAYPRLVMELLEHDGVGLALVRTAAEHAVVVGPRGRHDLTTGALKGEDPLALFGTDAADQLRHLDGIEHVGDLALISRIDPGTEEVAAFEELIGSHGGIGGWQTQPCLVYPADWSEPTEPLIGAPAVHRQLKRWIAAVQRERPAPEAPASGA
ncbi:MAG: alkaline phosphatase family protein [Candidatus Limnocylindria bacterium]